MAVVTSRPAALFAEVKRLGVYSQWRDLSRYFRAIFSDVELAGASVLDVGGGAGVAALYAASMGAGRVVCMEPELDGSTSRARERFTALRAAVGADVEFVASTLADYRSEPFDIVLLHDTINHLDEEAVTRLQRDPQAAEHYRRLLAPLRELVNRPGSLIVADASSRNAWADVGVRNPVARSIEWHKHQPPEIWHQVLLPLGFTLHAQRWTPYDPLGPLGDLLAFKSASYFLRSHFVITYLRP